MAISWVSFAQLPPQFWWFAFKRATEISNYIPIKIDGIITTPFEQIYRVKPDIRNLLSIFTLAYLLKYKNADCTELLNVENHRVAVILVGRATHSSFPLFYNPITKKTIISDDFSLEETMASGTAFYLEPPTGLHFNSHSEMNLKRKPPTFLRHNMLSSHQEISRVKYSPFHLEMASHCSPHIKPLKNFKKQKKLQKNLSYIKRSKFAQD